MNKYYDYAVFKKDTKGKYQKINDLKTKGCYVVADMCNYHERKASGEKIRIIKHYNFIEYMDIDVYFNNGYKYTYYNIPCTSGAYIDNSILLKEE